ncbi:MAG: hypothetical protein MPN21_24445 [Thermoanaerobaculia bacterium]|nr:hypothetical protein [Thermoanaerobaculia bacterium]
MKNNIRKLGTVLAFAVASGTWGNAAFAQLLETPTAFYWLGFPGLQAEAEVGARQGSAVAVGDFNCDGFGDLAMGAPADDVWTFVFPDFRTFEQAGSVTVVYGTSDGLGTDTQVVTLASFGSSLPIADFDFFGEVLTVGDFNGDDCDDLAIGAPLKDFGLAENVGAVAVALGRSDGVQPRTALYQGTFGITSTGEAGEQFGHALAAGDVDGDGFDDLVVGVPREDVLDAENAGSIHILFGEGSATGFATSGHRLYDRFSTNFPGSRQTDGYFGWAVAVGTGLFEGRADVFVSEMGRDVDSAIQAGAVLRLIDAHDPSDLFVLEFNQNSSGVPGTAEDYDRFGRSLAVGDFDGDGVTDIAVGVNEGLNIDGETLSAAGAVNVLYQAVFGGPDSQMWTQGHFASVEAEPFDRFGEVLAVGDFDRNGTDDLAIAVTGEDFAGKEDAGFVHILRGLQGFGFVGLDFRQNLSLPFPNVEDHFGAAMAAGPLGSGNSDDLVVGVPGKDFAPAFNTGIAATYESLALFGDNFESGDLSQWTSVAP